MENKQMVVMYNKDCGKLLATFDDRKQAIKYAQNIAKTCDNKIVIFFKNGQFMKVN